MKRRLENSSPISAISRWKCSVPCARRYFRKFHSSDRSAGCVFTRPGSIIVGDLASFVFRKNWTGAEFSVRSFSGAGTDVGTPCAIAEIYRYANAGAIEGLATGNGTGLTASLPAVTALAADRRLLAFNAFNARGTVTAAPPARAAATGGTARAQARPSATRCLECSTTLPCHRRPGQVSDCSLFDDGTAWL